MILLARHGQTVPNVEGRLLGRSDPELTGSGREQAQALAAVLAPLRPVVVLSSPLTRARETAAVVAGACGRAAEVDERLVEVDYGEYEGRPFAALPSDVVARWRDDPGFTPPRGESLRDVGVRMARFCEEWLDDRVVVAVSHVSPIKAAVTWALAAGDELAWRMRLDVASITRIGPGPVLLSFNETGHLS